MSCKRVRVWGRGGGGEGGKGGGKKGKGGGKQTRGGGRGREERREEKR